LAKINKINAININFSGYFILIILYTRHHRRAFRARYLVFYFLLFYFLINCNNNNLLLMHMFINCHLLTPRCSRSERTNRHRKKASTINFEIFEKCEFDLTSPFLERILIIFFRILKNDSIWQNINNVILFPRYIFAVIILLYYITVFVDN